MVKTKKNAPCQNDKIRMPITQYRCVKLETSNKIKSQTNRRSPVRRRSPVKRRSPVRRSRSPPQTRTNNEFLNQIKNGVKLNRVEKSVSNQNLLGQIKQGFKLKKVVKSKKSSLKKQNNGVSLNMILKQMKKLKTRTLSPRVKNNNTQSLSFNQELIKSLKKNRQQLEDDDDWN
jgi:hypothetical protein